MKHHFRALVAFLLCCTGTAKAQDMLPYPYHVRDWDNGLRSITIPTDFPNLVSVYLVVRTGSRNEVEEGKSGFAHFFEHMMFRGSLNFTSEEQGAIFKRIGADRNAYTTDDYTAYHTTFSKEDLETVLELEADRFQRLKYTEEGFKTEAKAVLGEYNKNSSDPLNQMFEVLQETAFDQHTYEHTTMGFLKDIQDMPNQFEYSLRFYERWYRPEYTTILVVGDVEPTNVESLIEKHFGAWERGGHTVDIPEEPEQQAPRRAHVSWPSPTEPWVLVAFKGPAFSTTKNDMTALDVISTLGFSPTSELYQKLFLRERKVSALFPYFPDHVDPFLVMVAARVKDPADVDYVEHEILTTFQQFREAPVEASRLEAVKRNLKYSFALGLDSSEAIAATLAGAIARGGSPEVVNQIYGLYDGLTPADLQRAAQETFQERKRTVITLSHGDLPRAPEADSSELGVEAVLQKTRSPLITFRLVFRAGSAQDPRGKEGLAYIASHLLTNGATKKRSYDDVVEALFPMASDVSCQVDKEMIVFSGTTHRDNLEAFEAIFREMLFEPGFDEEDLERVKANTKTFLDIELRRNNDEELGKEVLYGEIYAEHPYRHHSAGTFAGIDALTMDDVKRFYRERLTAANAVIGLAGDFPDALPRRLAQALLDKGSMPGEVDPLPHPLAIETNQMTIVEKQTLATGIHFGFPLDINRSHPDWPALWLIRSWLGEHRSENSHLYQRLRELRGLNYGDYAYIEYFPRGMFQFQPDPNLARTSQIFQVWIRPVEHANGQFALRAAYYELKKLIDEGLSEQAFEATRQFLSKNVHVLVASQDRQLGYALDSQWYGIQDFATHVKDSLAPLTHEDVNRVLRQYLRYDRMQFVIVTEDGERFRSDFLAGRSQSPAYSAPPTEATLAEDAAINALTIPMPEGAIEIVSIEDVFAK